MGQYPEELIGIGWENIAIARDNLFLELTKAFPEIYEEEE
jgi:hypothetical protein